MKLVRTYPYIIIFFVIFNIVYIMAEGFAAGTLVRVPHGYESIENLKIGDLVICFDNEHKLVARPIFCITKKSVSQYACIVIDDEIIKLSGKQKLYNTVFKSWMTVQDLKKMHVSVVKLKNESIDLYALSIAEYHNFFVSKADICAHNFIPVVIAGISFLFGSGVIEIAGISFGLASLGTYFGYQWHKNKHGSIEIGCIPTDNSQSSEGLYNANDAQAPGVPTEKDGYHPPKNWDGKKVKNCNGPGYGWPDKKGRIWVPTGPNGHGGPHWDVESPDGSYENVMPGGKIRGQK